MKEIIAALGIAMQELKTKADAALKGMNPIDQYEGAQEVAYAIRSLSYSKDCVEDMLSKVNEVMSKYDETVAAAAAPLAAAEIETKIAAKELIRKTDFDLAIENAKQDGEKVAAERIATERQEELAAAARRTEIATAHGKEVAEALPENVFAAAAFTEAAKAEIARRVDTLKDIGVAAAEKPAHFAEIISCGAFDDAGKAAFDARIAQLKDLGIGAASKPPTRKPVPGSGAPQFAAASKQEDAPAKPVAVF